MPQYRAPLNDYRFLLTELFDVSRLTRYQGYEDATPDILLTALEGAGSLCEDVLLPLNASGDREGCSWDAGSVRTPAGFREAWRAYVDGGWLGLSCDPVHGGQGLPLTMRFLVDEMACAANLSFAMFPGLTLGVYEGIAAHGTEELRGLWLPRLVAGDATGTMCLTEAHAGTDLGIIRTAAVPVDDGTFRIRGTKIFISAGEHDLTPNIVHLVLARLPDAPAGTRGISMFLVPKFLPDEHGQPGARNAVTCRSIEHKMGIRASPTCVLDFDDAVGWLVGEPHRGLRAMFTLMNGARLGVGLQGLGLAEVSYQNAVAYARERQQGRAPGGARLPDAPADPIVFHPDIRRGLLTMRAFVEGARALACWTALLIDQEAKDPDPARREEATDLIALMTPVIKAFFTDLGFASTNIGLQTLGGHGYIREFGMEQFVRDARIGQIYEGTNHIQALDLVGRKLPEGGGRLVRRYAARLEEALATARGEPRLAEFAQPLAAAAHRLQQATMTLAARGAGNPEEAAACASEYLHLFGYVALGHMWLLASQASLDRLDRAGGGLPRAFYDAKLATARFYVSRMLPQTEALLTSILAGAGSITAFATDAF
ncbi:MAG TPA: acyl-CoA dehydrogenase C-terminal domain-containing protein [Gemmatimonadaceae bacterium]|nr:acyl-CoA dehydrogenase C-terminal domain-containing protein [Gemmatimonadaceae bacterium]